MAKAQSSLEFMAIIGLMMTMLAIFSIGIMQTYQEIQESKEQVIVQDLAFKIKDEVTLAYNVQPGYFRTFIIPEVVDDVNFTIVAQSGLVIVSTGNQEASALTPGFIGCIGKGSNTIRKLQNSTILIQCS